MTLAREEITSGWQLSLADDQPAALPSGVPEALRGATIPATVPGQVHIDLEREGLLEDPAFDRNEQSTKWVGRVDWAYRTTLDVDPRGAERVDLVCDGLDTVTSLDLDGVQIGATRNMHRRYRFDLRDTTDGSNARSERELEIVFESPYREAGRLAAQFGTMPGPYDEPFPYVRKMASNFGWDWGLTSVTSGPWRAVAIERWSTARLAEVRPLVDVEAGEGVLDTHVRLERSGPGPRGERTGDLDQDGEDDDLVVVVTVSGHDQRQRSRAQVTPSQDEAVVTVRIPDAALWWPRGYGEQPLYDVEVQLQTVDGDVLDRRTFRTGFRSVHVETAPDAIGRPFAISVNSTPIDVRGVNWIPDDVIVSRVDRDRYEERLGQAAGANVNFVRVWGGGVYESEAFYETCDALGLLVWQDFAFACSAYPEGEPLRSEIVAEARDNVARLSRHPSLVVWNGNNENIWLHGVEDWADELGDRGWGLDYYLDLLPTIVDQVDPSRFYTAASPWSGDEDLDPNDVDHETHHSWRVWNVEGDEHYRDSVPRFVSEFGWQAPPQWRTMRDAITDEPMTATSPGVVHHQKAADGMGKLVRGLVPRFVADPADAPKDFDRWHYLTQLQQTRAIATAVEHWRTHWPRNTGVVVWQLNDLWPVSSWAAVDGAGRPKPLLHELRRLYDDTLLTIRPVSHVDTAVAAPAAGDSRQDAPQTDDDALGELADTAVLHRGTEPGPIEVAVRSSRRGIDTTVRVRRVDMAGRILAEATLPVRLDRAGVAVVPLPTEVGAVQDAEGELVVADMDWRRAVWTPSPDRLMRWEPAEYRATVRPVEGGVVLTIDAVTLIRDLLVQPDRIDPAGRIDRGFMTVLPGESVDFRIDGVDREHAEALLAAPVLWSLDRVLDAGATGR